MDMALKSKRQNGFGLVIALLIVGFTAGILTTFVRTQSGQTIRQEAEIAGWEGAEIARAARIHSRNEIRNRPNLVTTLSIPASGFGGTGPELITSNQLIAGGLIPAGFAREDGTNFFNALNQTVSVYLANYPIDGDPTDPATVPTAYVLFADNARTSPPTTIARVQDIVSAIRAQNVSVSAPTAVTANCNGGTAVALWDTGCLNANDYDLLIDGVANGADVFQVGSFLIPAWRSVSFDTRVMMRFPQPEQTGVQTMLTDLSMAELQDCDADNDGTLDQNFVQIPTSTGSIDSALCSAISDDAVALIDNRRSIEGVANITNSVGLFVNPQTAQDVRTDNAGVISVTADEANAFDIGGSLNGDGNAFAYGNNVTVGNELIADKNIFVTGNTAATQLARANVAVLNANNSTSTNLDVQNRPSPASSFNVSVAGATQNVSLLQSRNNFVAQSLDRNGGAGTPTVTANNEASFNTGLNANSMRVRGTGFVGSSNPTPPGRRYGFVTGSLQANNLSVTNANITRALSSTGAAVVRNTINVSDPSPANAECVGDCPKRARFVQCTNLQNGGFFPSLGYATMQDCLNDS